jgi:magnesium and cobalt transporter
MSDPSEKTLSTNDHELNGFLKRFKIWLRMNLRGKHHDNSLKEALEEVLEEHEEEGEEFPPEEQNLIKNVLKFSALSVKDIMTPRTDIKAVEYNIPLKELQEHISENRHTRVPVYNDTLDNIKGFIHIKDLVPMLSDFSSFNMALILRDVLFVPPSMKLLSLLVKMRVHGVHIAIVIDEYGGTDGLVTMEDLFEKIVGDIQDEHDEDEQEEKLSWNAERSCDVDARVLIEDIESNLSIKLNTPDDEADYDTLGGFIFYQIGRVPAQGDLIEHKSGIKFEILDADARRIHKIRIFAPNEPPEGNKE